MEVKGNFNRVAYGDINEFHLHVNDAGALAKLLEIIGKVADPQLTLVTDGNHHFSLRAGGVSLEELEDRRHELKREFFSAWRSLFFNRYSAFLLIAIGIAVGLLGWDVWKIYLVAPEKGAVGVLLPGDGLRQAGLFPKWVHLISLSFTALAGALLMLHLRAARLLLKQSRERLDMTEAEILRLKGKNKKRPVEGT